MQLFDTLTFGPSGLDRVAHFRGTEVFQEALRGERTGHAILFWRGKPFLSSGKTRELVRLPLDHPRLSDLPAPFLLGAEEEGLCFAFDISKWEPEVAKDEGFVDQSEQVHPDFDPAFRFADVRANMARLGARDAELVSTAKALFEWHRSHRFCAACGEPSEMVQSGWQRSCPACKTQHFPRVDPVVIMLITRGNKVLIGRSPGWPEHMYSLLAGFVEPGETPESAVRREVFEEAGIHVGRVGYLGTQPWSFPNSLMMGYRGEALNEEIKIDPNEIEDAIWVTREDMMTAMAGDHPTIRPARKGAIAEFIIRQWLADRLDT